MSIFSFRYRLSLSEEVDTIFGALNSRLAYIHTSGTGTLLRFVWLFPFRKWRARRTHESAINFWRDENSAQAYYLPVFLYATDCNNAVARVGKAPMLVLFLLASALEGRLFLLLLLVLVFRTVATLYALPIYYYLGMLGHYFK